MRRLGYPAWWLSAEYALGLDNERRADGVRAFAYK